MWMVLEPACVCSELEHVCYSGIPVLDHRFYSDARTLRLCSLLPFYIDSFEWLLWKCWFKPIKKAKESVQTLVVSSWALDSKWNRQHVRERGTQGSCCLTSLGQPGRREDAAPAAAQAQDLPTRWELPARPSWKAFGAVEENLRLFSPSHPLPTVFILHAGSCCLNLWLGSLHVPCHWTLLSPPRRPSDLFVNLVCV